MQILDFIANDPMSALPSLAVAFAVLSVCYFLAISTAYLTVVGPVYYIRAVIWPETMCKDDPSRKPGVFLVTNDRKLAQAVAVSRPGMAFEADPMDPLGMRDGRFAFPSTWMDTGVAQATNFMSHER